MNTKDFVKDGMTTELIKKNVNYIREYIEKPGKATLKERIEFLKTECEVFEKRYPSLFEMTISPNFSQDNLNYFLMMRDKIIKNELTSQEASEQVGMEWFKENIDLSKCEKKNDL
jgi:hypothetical protein